MYALLDTLSMMLDTTIEIYRSADRDRGLACYCFHHLGPRTVGKNKHSETQTDVATTAYGKFEREPLLSLRVHIQMGESSQNHRSANGHEQA
jgi:hypothetical protein